MGGADDNSELYVAIVALIIAVIAFATTVIQLAQSIIATARGLPNCDERVMGKWADLSSRKFKWWQLRLEIDFQAPVIFLAPAKNVRGPVKDEHNNDAPIFYANGTEESFDAFGVSEYQQDDAFNQRMGRQRVHTVNNELATWVTLLSAIQTMEKSSRSWEFKRWQDSLQPQPTLKEQSVTLAVGLQKKKRSFDANPTVKKPYATTTLCHLVELTAILGLYWKEFNRDQDKYRAEGNGYSLLGTRVDDFGLVFVFEKTGWATFEQNRIIPTREVKELCFGSLPTFYREVDPTSDEMWSSRLMEQRTMSTLRLGSRQEIVDTLSLIGCNTNTTLYYQKDGSKNTHLFPVTFEIMGMLGRTLHVMNRPFRFLPNPTIFAWNSQRFNMRRMLSEFEKSLRANLDASSRTRHAISEDLERVMAMAAMLQRKLPEQNAQFAPQDLNEIHGVIDSITGMLSEATKDKKVVLDVLRRHIQEVLLAINTTADQTQALNPASPISRPVSFDDLLEVPPERRERQFMMKYFGEIRLRVISIDSEHDDLQAQVSLHIHTSSPQQQEQTAQDDMKAQSDQRRDQKQAAQPQPATDNSPNTDTAAASPDPQHRAPAPSGSPPMSNSSQFPSAGLSRPVLRADTDTTGWGIGSRTSTNQSHAHRSETWNTTMSDRFEPRRNDIWCALVLRMLCWLLLHDFDKRDVQVPKSELMGSRLPVYIM
ncbi:hypothetical protein JX266_010534 [Neoarthrinium moseri]|nr:hypothetical protein JX266_010534 [Neoarthrinium moseri]